MTSAMQISNTLVWHGIRIAGASNGIWYRKRPLARVAGCLIAWRNEFPERTHNKYCVLWLKIRCKN